MQLNMCRFSYKNVAFGVFADRFIELAADVFSRAYAKVYSHYWNDSFERRMVCSYTSVDWDDCIYETYIPIRAHPTVNMTFYRIVLKVTPEISQQEFKELAYTLMEPMLKPAGVIDSELIVVVAQKAKGYVRGFRHVRKPGHLAAVIVDKNPWKAFLTLCRLIANFIRKRVKALCEKLGIHYECKEEEIYYKMFMHGSAIINSKYNSKRRLKLYLGIRKMLMCLSHTLSWIIRNVLRLKREMEAETLILRVLKPFRGLNGKLNMLQRVKAKLVSDHNERATREALKFLEACRAAAGG